MKLTSELKYCGCNETPKEYKARLVETLMKSFPNRTIDSLVCEPLDALRYCSIIRKAIGTESLSDFLILNPLLNIRKAKNCPKGLKLKGKKKFLRTKLRELDCELTAIEFKDLVSDCLGDMYKSQTLDRILCYPREAMALCNYVRNRAEFNKLTDQLVLSTLMNNRKAVR